MREAFLKLHPIKPTGSLSQGDEIQEPTAEALLLSWAVSSTYGRLLKTLFENVMQF